jgi:hypothetical protein
MPKKRITIVIPDAGPLISLATGKALDLLLLLRPGVRLVLTDFVHFEVTVFQDRFLDGAQIAAFIAQHPEVIEILPTSIGEFAIPGIREKLRQNPRAAWPNDLGELSISSFITTSKDFNPGEPTLVLIEDDWFTAHSFAVPGNVHLLSTSAFLQGLEEQGIIPSAAEIRSQIQSRRPGFKADFAIDQEAPKIAEGSTWRESFARSKDSS